MDNKIITSEEHEVVFKEVLSGHDHRAYRKVLLDIGEENITKADSLEALENVVISTTVVSFDGTSEDILGKILALPSWDYDLVLKKANEIIEVMTKKKEQILNGSMKTGSKEQKSD